MNNLSNILLQIIHKENDFCCLCLKTIIGDRTELDDEVVLHEHNIPTVLKVSDIISHVLGDEVFVNVAGFKTICLHCASSIVNTYKFILETKENIKNLSNAIEHLNNAVNESPGYLKGCETLYVILNPTLNSSSQYFDSIGCISSTTEALERLQSLTRTNKQKESINEKVKIKTENVFTLKSSSDGIIKKFKNTINTVDMLFNKNDLSVLKCKECLKEFPSVSNLRNHFLRIHAPKEFKCPKCPKSYGTLSFLNAHRAESHIGMMCSDCGKTFNNMHSLKRHETAHFMKLICQDCGRVYKNQNTFKKHIDNNVCQTAVRHSPADAKFECDYCHKKYTQKMSLRVHIQYVHGNYKSHVCKWCNKKFWCQSRLKAHIVKHTKEKNFICTICSGKFVTKESLLYHTRIHTGERPYPCPLCDSRFLSASRRAAHVRSQHTNTTVECELCHSKFKSVHNLIKHKKDHEKVEPRKEILDDSDMQDKTEISVKLHEEKQIDDQEENLIISSPEHKYVYNINHGDLIELQLDPDNDNKREYYLINKVDDNDNQHVSEGGQVYFEVTDVGNYDIKVSENVEV